MTDKSEEQKKEHTRRKFAFAYYKLRQWLDKSIKDNDDFQVKNKLGKGEHNMVSAQSCAYKAAITKCRRLENDYEKNGTQNI